MKKLKHTRAGKVRIEVSPAALDTALAALMFAIKALRKQPTRGKECYMALVNHRIANHYVKALFSLLDDLGIKRPDGLEIEEQYEQKEAQQ